MRLPVRVTVELENILDFRHWTHLPDLQSRFLSRVSSGLTSTGLKLTKRR
jgi:hypothetical protein